jgi:hypothetical protein
LTGPVVKVKRKIDKTEKISNDDLRNNIKLSPKYLEIVELL